MRTIGSDMLTELAKTGGTDPLFAIHVQWVPNGGWHSYTVEDSILDISEIDAAVQASNNSDVAEISVKLHDTGGLLKNIFDNYDIHKRPAKVYQYFKGVTGEVLLFDGTVNGSIIWDEGDRSFSFRIVTKIEDREVGFSIEEGNFNYDSDLVGKAWPLVFGNCVNVPALQISDVYEGSLATGVGIRDWTLDGRIAQANKIYCPRPGTSLTLSGTDIIVTEGDEQKDCTFYRCQVVDALQFLKTQQMAYEFPSFTVYRGETFPQNIQLILNINEALFVGYFSGNVFNVAARYHPNADTTPEVIDAFSAIAFGIKQTEMINLFKSDESLACNAIADDKFSFLINPDTGEYFGTSNAADLFSRRGLAYQYASEISQDVYNKYPQGDFFWANPGTTVRLQSNPLRYIANLLPSTIINVKAYRNLNGSRELLTIPDTAYQVVNVDYGTYITTEIVFPTWVGPEWETDIYVSLESTVGPNTVDIMEWLIGKYTDYTTDAASFAAVKAAIDNYPMHFALQTRPNILTMLRDLAYQARCGLFLRDGKFFLKYLAETGTSVATFTESDVDFNSLRIGLTETEDLITKITASWTEDYLGITNKIIMRNNTAKYGISADETDFYCFNSRALVEKAAAFWLIRNSNTWKKISFTAPIKYLAVEVFDTVTVDLPDFAPTPLACIVESATIDSKSMTMSFTLWTPVVAGTTSLFTFAYPSDISATLTYPPTENFTGSNQEPNFATRAPTGHPLHAPIQNYVTRPSDLADTKPTTDIPKDTGLIDPGAILTRPDLNGFRPATNFALSNSAGGGGGGGGNIDETVLDKLNEMAQIAQSAYETILNIESIEP